MTTEYDRRTVLKSAGLAGVAATLPLAGCSASSDTSSADTPTPDPTTESSTGSDGEEWTETTTVDMTDELTYEPKRIQVSAGSTVTWETVGAVGHTVTAYEDEIPDGATYFASGGFDSEQAARDGYPDEGNVTEGGSYEHTFETEGTYKYFCIPHEMNGMVGFVMVV